MYKNIFYFRSINKIGGTEQFLYEIAKKYHDYDITVFFDAADPKQLARLRRYIRCKKRIPGQKIECEKAFYNYDIDMIEDVEAKEHIFVSHGIYQVLRRKPPIDHPKLTKIIGVSQYSCDMIDEYARKLGVELKAEKCYDPLTLEAKEKVLHLVSAGRIDDKVKGGERTLRLIDALDKYCERTGKHYIWTIFSKPVAFEIASPNVVLMKPRVDVRPYIADADYVLQLSDDMETYCYTVNEALKYGVPIVTTPLSVLKEFNITDNEHICLEWDCSNVDEVAKNIFEKKVKAFKYEPVEDQWKDFLDLSPTTYQEDIDSYYLVEATGKSQNKKMWDVERTEKLVSVEDYKRGIRYYPKRGEQWVVDFYRKEFLVENGFATVIKKVKQNTKK